MKLSNEQRLLAAMLASIQRKLSIGEPQDEVDPDFVTEALYHHQDWAIIERYPGLFQAEPIPPYIATIRAHVEMWNALEDNFDALTPADQAKFEEVVIPGGRIPKFPGYNAKEEQEYLIATRYLVVHLHQYPQLAECPDFNARERMLPRYEAMLGIYRDERSRTGAELLSADQLLRILEAAR